MRCTTSDWLAPALLALGVTLAAGCGGGGGGGVGGGATEAGGGASAEAGEDPTEGGQRRAARGAGCDFGGAADRTCQRGLFCCYGPPEDPGEQGECLPECPEY